MRFHVSTVEAHAGKTLVVDVEQEIFSLFSAQGELLGSVSWRSIIEWIQTADAAGSSTRPRVYPRAALAVRVRYTTEDGKTFESMTSGIGGGGLFIETSAPLPAGTPLSVEFALPDRPWLRVTATAKVAWIRRKPERHMLLPGMGLQFTEIEPQALDRLVALVATLNQTRR